MERLRHNRELREFRQRLDAGNNGHGDASLSRLFHKTEIGGVVVEKLGHGIFRAERNFFLEPLEVGLGIERLFVLFGIARHAVTERLARHFNRRAVDKEAFVEAVHLFLQLRGVGVAVGRGDKAGIFFCLVAAQQQDVFNAEELQVEEHVFYILARKA